MMCTAIARQDVDLAHAAAVAELPRQTVFAAAAAHHYHHRTTVAAPRALLVLLLHRWPFLCGSVSDEQMNSKKFEILPAT